MEGASFVLSNKAANARGTTAGARGRDGPRRRRNALPEHREGSSSFSPFSSHGLSARPGKRTVGEQQND
jgi:hypothetical protein